jgi:monoterpene epsilon-lactone hydrolase
MWKLFTTHSTSGGVGVTIQGVGPSAAHEAMVERIVSGGMRTPEVFPGADAVAMARAAEAEETLRPVDAMTVEYVDAGGVPAVLVTPVGHTSLHTVVYFHGGGYIWMNPTDYVPVLAKVAAAARWRCLGVHYRRAPEHPYPAAVEDAVTAYEWLLAGGVEPADVALAGDSAGGGLAIAALMEIRDRGLPLPSCGAAVSPWTDLAVSGASADSADDPVVSGNALRAMAEVYLAGADATSPTASPLYGDLVGLPPLQVQVGSRESLLDDSRRFVAKARAAGVEVDFIEHSGTVHMWLVFDPEIPESQRAFRLLGEFVTTAR